MARRRTLTPEQREKAEEERRQLVESLHDQLQEGVTKMRSGEDWKRWLSASARFHQYSPRNILLLLMQNPDITHVASYRTWQSLGRQVVKGESALRVLGPVTRRVEVLDAHGKPVLDDQGKSKVAQQIVGVKPVPVFDISQTDGDPLPEPPRPTLLAGQAPEGLWEGLAARVKAEGFELRRGDPGGAANGITDFGERVVIVRDDVDDAQAVKTLSHELGHVLMHNPFEQEVTAGLRVVCRGDAEVEAESVAYIIGQAHGLDTSDYTFAYVNGWSRHDEDAVLNTAVKVIDTAHAILGGLDTIPEQPEVAAQRDRATTLAERAQTITDQPAPQKVGERGLLERLEQIRDRSEQALAAVRHQDEAELVHQEQPQPATRGFER